MSSVRSWLEKQGLESFAAVFEANHITFADLGSLNHAELREGLGVAAFSERKRILEAIDRLREDQTLERAPIMYPEGLSAEELPSYLAHPWQAFCAEDHPRVKLHWLTDTAELVVRWAVSVTLAEVLVAHDLRLPKKLAAKIRGDVERPTLGRWVGVLRELSANAPAEPLLGAAPFTLYDQAFAPRFDGNGTLETSLLVLRNQVAHGGGMSSAHASALLECHTPQLCALLREVMAATRAAQVIALEAGEAHLLLGIHAHRVEQPAALRGESSGTWLVVGERAMPLLPLAIYAPVRMVNSAGELQARPGGSSAQVFTRAHHDRLSYTPLGRDEAHSETLDVAFFREVFRLDEVLDMSAEALTVEGVKWDDALKEARARAEELVGRKEELDRVKQWLKSRSPYTPETPRIGWISGGPGLGKSNIMAKLAADYSSSGAQRGFYFHKFSSAGNARSNRRMFLKLLEAALWSWAPLRAITAPPSAELDGDALIDAVELRLRSVAQLEPPNPRAPRPAIWIFLDNFDEMVEQDRRFVDLVRKFALPGTVWLLCGRPEHGLDQELSGDDAERLFERGMPLMSGEDLRAMLLEGMGSARYALLRRDEDDERGEAHNLFVERVVQKARGLPLYVELLLADLRSGALTVEDDDKLPDGLSAYYNGLMERVGLSTVSRDLPLLVALLARAEEPLDVPALATLLAPRLEDAPRYMSRVSAALRVGQSLLRVAPTPEGREGYALYHLSFREYVGGSPGEAGAPPVPPAPRLTETVDEAERLLYRSAERWAELPDGSLRSHLFRWGTTYALELQGDLGLREARERLTSYAYLSARHGALPASAVVDLVSEYGELLRRTPEEEQRELMVWEAFIRERAHLLASAGVGSGDWPVERALLQLAMEHADASPVTAAAEAWLAAGHGADWRWLRSAWRPQALGESAVRRVFPGHAAIVNGAHRLEEDARMLSWGADGALKLWSVETGEELDTLQAHAASVDGVLVLEGGGRAVSWSRDGGLVTLDLSRGEIVHRLIGHERAVLGACVLSTGELLSWSEDKTLRGWSLVTGAEQWCWRGHTRALRGALVLSGGEVLSWSDDRTLRAWRTGEEESAWVWRGHTREVAGVLEGESGVVSWGVDGTLRRWELGVSEGDEVVYEGHEDAVLGAMWLDGETLLSWGKDGTLRRWSRAGVLLTTYKGHRDWVDGALVWGDGLVLSWSKDKTLALWEVESGKRVASLEEHAGWVRGARRLKGGELLSWAGCGTGCVWEVDAETREAKPLARLEGHTAGIWGMDELGDGRLLSWSWDGSLRLWEWHREELADGALAGHRGWIHAHELWDGERAITWANDSRAMLWSLETGSPDVVCEGHERSVDGVLRLEDGRLLTWSSDQTLGVWHGSTGERQAVMAGHDKKIQGALSLGDGRVVSWGSDGLIKVWRVDTGECERTLSGHKKLVQGVRALDGGRLVSWSSDGLIKVWRVETGELVHDLKGHSKLVKGLKLLEGERALSWSSDTTLRVWDLESGECVGVWEGHGKLVSDVRGLDGARVASIDNGGRVIVWDVASGVALLTLETGDEAPDGVTLLVRGGEAQLLGWFRKRDVFVVWRLEDGETLEEVSMSRAVWERPELWRARQRAGHFETLCGAWRAQGGESGVVLLCDAEQGDRVEEEVVWRGTGSWAPMGLLARGVITAHAGNYMRVLHLYRGAERVTLGGGPAIG